MSDSQSRPSKSTSWFQEAIFYEILPRGFSDSNSDGVGDLRGITEKLDYLEWLGINCIWLMPYYKSPLRDGGYDISDYMTILPEYGENSDLDALIARAHQKNIRVIADLVVNHTSDQHPWFLESKRDRTNPKADWYVWSDTDEPYREARIIFIDTESSNWAWSLERQQYYWHRFFYHQPDLNFNNVEVEHAMIEVVDFWLSRGLDGFRMDAVPYLFEREGTNGENLPETHAFLKRVRSFVDSKYADKVLLAEANQWPKDVVDYFGNGDECHMCFNFPIMPRLFMSVKMESAQPIIDSIEQTPAIPEGCQWGIFLRNHDELTLEMVTDEEREFMYRAYVSDPRMRRNVGIGRRLAPLIENDRRVAELLHALLFSLPGTPILYYGDEILMGDNIYLGDRDSVRTPMQWSPDRNAGFSKADFARLYLPLNMDPVYGYESVNVESQTRNPSSFLHWLRNMLWIRRSEGVFGTGAFELLRTENPSCFAYVRSVEDQGRFVLCVNNLARSAQPLSLDLSGFVGRVPYELLGRTRFPAIGSDPYFFTLPPYGVFWFELVRQDDGDEMS
ncbi:MAG: maltose alpha-D-glucosyltransferase [Acidimicrobiales bacterium]